MAKKPEAPHVPDYWEEAKAELMKRDRIMRKLIPQFGDLQLVGRGEPFVTLARSIVGQQISVKAAQSVWERLLEACPKMTPSAVQKMGITKLQSCGLSKRKAEYITDLALHFRDGSVHEKDWSSMDDEAVIAELIQIRGIGRWTAEMFLIFNLLRPNILPLDDIGLLLTRGLQVRLERRHLGLEPFEPGFEFGHALLQRFQLLPGPGQHVGLDLEFFARQQIELGEPLVQHRPHVFFKIFRRRLLQYLVQAVLKFIKKTRFGIHGWFRMHAPL